MGHYPKCNTSMGDTSQSETFNKTEQSSQVHCHYFSGPVISDSSPTKDKTIEISSYLCITHSKSDERLSWQKEICRGIQDLQTPLYTTKLCYSRVDFSLLL